MKRKRNEKATPEEILRAACEEGLGVELDYSRVRKQLDVDAIVRAGAVKKALSAPTPTPIPSRRSAVATVFLVLAVLILTPAIAVGSFFIARMTMGDEPPVEEILTNANGEIILPPAGDAEGTEDTEGGDSVWIPPLETLPDGEEAWENLFDLSESYVTDGVLYLRADHLDPDMGQGVYPSIVKIRNSQDWEKFIGEEPISDDPALRDFFTNISADYLYETNMLVLITQGRSGSIRYRLDEMYEQDGALHMSVVAEVPPALTMDIVHWCIVIPMDREDIGKRLMLSWQDESTEEATDPLLHFQGYGDGSYAENGYLYGRIGQVYGMTYPHTQVVSSFAEWQAMLDPSCLEDPNLDADFVAGLDRYNEEFFTEGSLIILYLEEWSGSIRHSIGLVGIEKDQLSVTVTSKIPEVFTDDMAYWAILIPISKEYADRPLEVEYTTARLD